MKLLILSTCSGNSPYSHGDDSVRVVSAFPTGRMAWGHLVLRKWAIGTSRRMRGAVLVFKALLANRGVFDLPLRLLKEI